MLRRVRGSCKKVPECVNFYFYLTMSIKKKKGYIYDNRVDPLKGSISLRNTS